MSRRLHTLLGILIGASVAALLAYVLRGFLLLPGGLPVVLAAFAFAGALIGGVAAGNADLVRERRPPPS